MKFLETEEEKKSFAITSIIFALLVLLCIFFGLTYMDPPPENGIAVNFGTSDTGSGEVEPMDAEQPQAQPTASQPETSNDDNLTQDDESPVVAPKKDIVKKNTTPTKSTTPTKTTKPAENPTPKVNSAASNMIKGKGTKPSGGEGNDNEPGNKGPENGMYGNSYWGAGKGTGSGNGTKWGLSDRNIKGNNKVLQECNEEGRIVVKVTVNNQGSVVAAEYSAGGSNSTSACLKKAAIATAYTFKWNADSNAPTKQIGFIEINFRVGE